MALTKQQHDRRYYERHREQQIQNARVWALANPDRRRDIGRRHDAYRKAVRRDSRLTPEERQAARRVKAIFRVRAWTQAHPEQHRISRVRRQTRRRARLLGAVGTFSAGQFRARWDYYAGRCWMCSGPADTIDHVIPLARGGSNWPANLRPACRPCNSRKGARH